MKLMAIINIVGRAPLIEPIKRIYLPHALVEPVSSFSSLLPPAPEKKGDHRADPDSRKGHTCQRANAERSPVVAAPRECASSKGGRDEKNLCSNARESARLPQE